MTNSDEKSISVLLVARTSSSRCPNKVLRDFSNGQSLFEILCREMKGLNYPFFAAVGEQPLIDIAEKNDVPVIVRQEDEVNAHGPLRKVFACIEQVETTHVMLLTPCTPFLRAKTVNAACEFLLSNPQDSITSAIKEQNWFFNEKREPLVPINIYNMTSNDLCIYALANAFEAFPVKRFLDEGIYYTFEDPTDPHLYEIPKTEAIDIDTEEEFRLASYMWEVRHGK